jgi:hypothetical protein
MTGVLLEDHVAEKPAIRIGLRIKGDKREHLQEFKQRASDMLLIYMYQLITSLQLTTA